MQCVIIELVKFGSVLSFFYIHHILFSHLFFFKYFSNCNWFLLLDSLNSSHNYHILIVSHYTQWMEDEFFHHWGCERIYRFCFFLFRSHYVNGFWILCLYQNLFFFALSMQMSRMVLFLVDDDSFICWEGYYSKQFQNSLAKCLFDYICL